MAFSESGFSEAASPSQLLQDCYNGAKPVAELPPPADFHDFLDGNPVNLHLERVWWSGRRSPLPLTLFTSATLDRLHLLEAQCHSYPGPLSAAIYLPLVLHPDPASGNGSGTTRTLGRRRAARWAAWWGRSAAAAAADGAAGSEGTGKEVAAAEASRRRNAQLLSGAVRQLQAAFDRLESSPAACSLTLALYSEALSDRALAALMPTNALRNAALLAASSPLVAMVDADLSVSRGLGQAAANSSRVSELLACATRGRVLWVLPAWETRRGLDTHIANLVVDSALAGGKTSLERLWRHSALWPQAAVTGGSSSSSGYSDGSSRSNGRHLQQRRLSEGQSGETAAAAAVEAATEGVLHPFDLHDFAGGHGATDYERFFRSDVPYPVTYTNGYEPWYITARDVTFPYDERFRGWYGDKFSHVLHSVGRGFGFVTLPDVWIIHRPHPPVAARSLYRHEAGGPSGDIDHLSELMVRRFLPLTKFAHYINRVHNLEHRQRRDLARRHGFRPQVGASVARCRAELPWWRPADNKNGNRSSSSA